MRTLLVLMLLASAFFAGWIFRERTFFDNVASLRPSAPVPINRTRILGDVSRTKNYKSNSFIVATIGSDDGLRTGDIVIIKRNDDIIGVAQITRVDFNVSVGIVIKLSDDVNEIRTGDRVVALYQ